MAELDGENVPAYRVVRVTAPEPVAALGDMEACRARETYPEILLAGGPVFGVVREREAGGWEVVSSFSGLAPPRTPATTWAASSASWRRRRSVTGTRPRTRSTCGRRSAPTGKPSTR
ncbi:DUF5954 family protein [Streptomyces sp. NPDC001667]